MITRGTPATTTTTAAATRRKEGTTQDKGTVRISSFLGGKYHVVLVLVLHLMLVVVDSKQYLPPLTIAKSLKGDCVILCRMITPPTIITIIKNNKKEQARC